MGHKEHAVSTLISNGVSPVNIPEEWLEEYCHMDVEITEALFLKQRELLEEKGLLHIQYSRCLLTPALTDMEFNGLSLNKDRVQEEYDKAVKELAEVQHQLNVMAKKNGYEGINWRSGKQVAEYLYDVLGFEEVRYRGQPVRTEKDARKTDTATIEALKATNKKQKDFVETYQKIGKVAAKLSKNLNFFQEVCTTHGGNFRGVLNQGTTKTHRLSSSGIPVANSQGKGAFSVQLQNIPRQFKRLFKARRDDWEIFEADGCFTAGHKILMSDMTWRNVEDVAVGDILVGVQEEVVVPEGKGYQGRDRKMLPSRVEVTRTLDKECLQLLLGDGTSVTVSKEHPFLAKDSSNGSYRWMSAEQIAKSKYKVTIRKLLDKEEYTNDRAWGKLAAYIDGEGSVSHDKIQLTQQAGSDVCDDMESTLRELELPYTKHHYRMSEWSTKPVCSLTVTGMRNLFRIKQAGRPVKLDRNHHLLWEDKCPKGHSVDVLSVEDAGVRPVYSIQTSTKTYIAEGLISHNCQLEFRVAAMLTGDPVAIAEIINEDDVHQITADYLTAAGEPTSRQDAKSRTFRPLFAGTSGTPAEQAYCKFFQEKYHVMYRAQQSWVHSVLADKELVTPYGMRYYWPHCKMQGSGYITHTTEIFNAPVQGAATAEIIPIAIVFAWQRLRDMQVRLTLTVHDSVIGEKHRDVDADELRQILAQAFTIDVYNFLEQCYNYSTGDVPLSAGVKIGEHWGEGTEYVATVYPHERDTVHWAAKDKASGGKKKWQTALTS